MKTTKLLPLVVIEVEFDTDQGLRSVNLFGVESPYDQVGNAAYFSQGEMPGKRFRVTIEALDVTSRLEES